MSLIFSLNAFHSQSGFGIEFAADFAKVFSILGLEVDDAVRLQRVLL